VADSIEADPDALQTLVDSLTASVSAIDLQLQGLDGELTWLMGSWSGDAAQAYLTAQTGWNGSLEELRSWLGAMAGVLSGISARYTETESTVIARCS
jgi:WXG100 family type VII secretion target